MSSDPTNDLSLPDQEAGILFRAEMWATNAFLGYWKHLVAVIIVVLLAILVYGQWTSSVRSNQRALTAEVAEAWSDVPPTILPGQISEEDQATLRSVADELTRIGNDGRGPSAVEAHLKAAELYRLLGETESQRASLEAATEYARGPLEFAARSGIANLELQDGDPEVALSMYRELMEDMDGFLAQQAAMNLALAYEHLDRPSDARAVYMEFLSLWPASAQAEQVQDRLDRLGTAVTDAPQDEALEDEAPQDEAPEDEAPQDEAPEDDAPADDAPVDDGAPPE